jgi:hypothetical protein
VCITRCLSRLFGFSVCLAFLSSVLWMTSFVDCCLILSCLLCLSLFVFYVFLACLLCLRSVRRCSYVVFVLPSVHYYGWILLFFISIVAKVESGLKTPFRIDSDDALRFGERLCVPTDRQLKNEILSEAHESGYTIHPGETKMYQDFKGDYWWRNMRREIARLWWRDA